MNVIDTNILIDYFEGTLPKKYVSLLAYSHISTITLAELADKFERKNISFTKVKPFLESNFTILPITFEIAQQAAKIKKQQRKKHPKFGISDAIILATSKQHNLQLYTKDYDFAGEATILDY